MNELSETLDESADSAPPGGDDPELAGDEPGSAAADAADDAGDDTPERPAKQGRFDKRIGQLTGENYALKADRDYWRDRALQAQVEAAPPAAEVQDDTSAIPQRPKLADYDHDVEAYAEALGEWTDQVTDIKVEKKAAEVSKATEDARNAELAQSERNQKIESFQAASQAFAQANPDFFEIVGNPTIPLNESITNTLLEIDNGPAVAYHLGLNPEIAHRIAVKSPMQISIELARISEKLASQPAGESSKSSGAPEPPTPIGTSRGKAGSKDPSKMSIDEWMAWRKKQVRNKANG